MLHRIRKLYMRGNRASVDESRLSDFTFTFYNIKNIKSCTFVTVLLTHINIHREALQVIFLYGVQSKS